jgi:hypothetical protein
LVTVNVACGSQGEVSRDLSVQDIFVLSPVIFARLVSADPTIGNPTIEQAFALVKRELFAGPGPWSIYSKKGYRRNSG